MAIDALKFQKSITKELDVTKDRVRNLIADANWGEEGRYKEAILRNTIKKFLPSHISIGTGFILKDRRNLYDRPLERDDVSNQIDIIFYNNTCPPLFFEGDFIITNSTNVKGIIEVKSTIDSVKLRNSIKKGDSNGEIINDDIFNGIFVFEYNNRMTIDILKKILCKSQGRVNHIAFGTDFFIRLWNRKIPDLHPNINCDKKFYGFYEIPELAFSYFISNAIESMIKKQCGDRNWFLFPIEGTKEKHRIDSVCLENEY